MDNQLENLTDYHIERIKELLPKLKAGESICFDRRDNDEFANLFVGMAKKEYYYVGWQRDGDDKKIRTAFVDRSQRNFKTPGDLIKALETLKDA